MKKTAFMISHTHWDREWYLTLEQFRIKMLRLIDDLLDTAENDPDFVSFMLDGQAVVVQDYLRVKPQNRARLEKAMASGKIVCGPWYILPDELLISGEAHIRNFLVGQQLLEDMGGGMKIAYLPDSFGHPAQMPQIISGLGMEAMVFWRGLSSAVKNTEFYWAAPENAARILCVHMPHGYGNCGRLSADMGQTIPRLEELVESLGAKGLTNNILLMNGSDHIAAQLDIHHIAAKANTQLQDAEIRLCRMEEFLQQLKQDLPGLETFSGEFRSGERAMLLGGTLSTRMAHKQANDKAQKLAERYIEPMLAAETLMGIPTLEPENMTYLWQRILENHPHDSICGCSIDEVHREMDARFAAIDQIEKDTLRDSSRRIFARWQQAKTPVSAREVLLFEPSAACLPSYVEIEAGLDPVLVQEVNFTKSIIEDYEADITHPEIPSNVTVTDENGRLVPHVLLGAEKGYESLYQDETLPEIYKVNKVRLGLLLPGSEYGLHRLDIRPAAGEPPKTAQKSGGSIENGFYKITVENCRIDILDKTTGRLYKDAAKLVDKGDAGDEYSYSWPEEDSVFTFEDSAAKVSAESLPGIGERLEISGTMQIPAKLEPSRKRRSSELAACPVCIRVNLYEGVNRIDFEVDFTNNAEDHRLQIQFPSGIKTDYSESYNTFHVEKRPVKMEVPPQWMEYPQNTHPSHGIVCLSDGQRGITAAAEGLPEFEAEQHPEQTMLNITLLRCVGWLSRTDLLTRKGNGGWTIATPDAQCPGKHSCKLALQIHEGGWAEGDTFAVMDKFLHPSYCAPVRLDAACASVSSNCLGFLSGLPKQLHISAVKPAQAGDGVVVRLVNLLDTAACAELELPDGASKAGTANMAEQWQQDLPVSGGKLQVEVAPCEIKTLYFKV